MILNQSYFKAKKQGTFYSKRKDLIIKSNGRSTDFIIPSFQIGCEASCSYCYVNRHRPYGNPLETYKNHIQIQSMIVEHAKRLSTKIPNQTHPFLWTYDIGESTDCMSNKTIDITNKYIKLFQNKIPNGMCSFATKYPANYKRLIEIKNRKARIRISLIPSIISNIVEIGTNSIDKRIESIPYIYEKGYEVHINLSPVIIFDNWLKEYEFLLLKLKNSVSDEILKQIKYEIIFLTHHQNSHDMNKNWNLKGEQLLWIPSIQERKKEDGTVRYNYLIKNKLIKQLKGVINDITPDCPIRYCF